VLLANSAWHLAHAEELLKAEKIN